MLQGRTQPLTSMHQKTFWGSLQDPGCCFTQRILTIYMPQPLNSNRQQLLFVLLLPTLKSDCNHPQSACIHQKVCQFLVYNGSHTCCTFSNHSNHSFQPLRKPCCSNSECVHKHIHQPKTDSCLNKLLFQPYYKTRCKTYALKNVQCVILPQLTSWSLTFEAEQKYICHKLYFESLEWAVSIAQDSSVPILHLVPIWLKAYKKNRDCSFYFHSNCSDPLL